MKNIFKLKPARSQAIDNNQMVADLDALIAKPIYFRWNGKAHEIKPISTKEFLVLTEKLNQMDQLRKQAEIPMDDLVDSYSDIISVVCDSIQRSDILSMTQAQVSALFQLILDCMTGKAQVDIEKKKNQVISEKPPGT